MLARIFKSSSIFNKATYRFSAFDKVVESNDATAVCLESVAGTIKGLQKANYVVEHNPNLTGDDKKKLK